MSKGDRCNEVNPMCSTNPWDKARPPGINITQGKKKQMKRICLPAFIEIMIIFLTESFYSERADRGYW